MGPMNRSPGAQETGGKVMTKVWFAVVVLGFLGLLGALGLVSRTQAQQPAAQATASVVNDKQFHDRLLKIAEIYTAYGRVDDELRWAPYFCRAPQPAQARFSRSSDETTHGQKLYSVFARDRDAYMRVAKPRVTGQVIVKESWTAKETTERPQRGGSGITWLVPDKDIKVPQDLAPPPQYFGPIHAGSFQPLAQKKGKWYQADKRGDLFIMMQLAPGTPGTDNGWVYGTVSTDGKTVTSAGRVASCMKCHETRKDRVFGLNASAEESVSKP
jgi:hypothetical protein